MCMHIIYIYIDTHRILNMVFNIVVFINNVLPTLIKQNCTAFYCTKRPKNRTEFSDFLTIANINGWFAINSLLGLNEASTISNPIKEHTNNTKCTMYSLNVTQFCYYFK